jgi:hypothetical protein
MLKSTSVQVRRKAPVSKKLSFRPFAPKTQSAPSGSAEQVQLGGQRVLGLVLNCGSTPG